MQFGIRPVERGPSASALQERSSSPASSWTSLRIIDLSLSEISQCLGSMPLRARAEAENGHARHNQKTIEGVDRLHDPLLIKRISLSSLVRNPALPSDV